MRHGLLHFRSTVTAVTSALLLTSCDQPTAVHDHESVSSVVTAGEVRLSDALKGLRAATARLHATQQADASGYEATEHCVAHPSLGAMGQHWANPGLVDPVFDPQRPEVVLYEPTPDGLKLVAVEFVVIDVGQPRPHFDGHPLDVGGAPIPVPHWTLHVWLYKDNPAGVFTPFNPAVSCS